MKKILRQLCRPRAWTSAVSVRARLGRALRPRATPTFQIQNPDRQDLDVYSNPEFARALETWGEDSVWREIQFLLAGHRGRVLDIACGTGTTIQILSRFSELDIHGCDISALLIRKAIERGIPRDHLTICDATRMNYKDNCFEYAYSIGSLEHFTENQVVKFISECYRTTRVSSFHMIPIARNGRDEGWIKTVQSYYNNSVEWWLPKFKTCYETVYSLDSTWQDEISVGKWFVCVKGKIPSGCE